MNKTVEEYLFCSSHPKRPNAIYYIETIFRDFIELHGDRLSGDDPSIIGGIATFDEMPITVVGQLRGRNLEENIKYNYSMTHPEGFRKALRLMKQAEKFNRPIICFVDTVGAFPGEEAEKRGQSVAIANNLMQMATLKVPIISILIGNGGSGGALALCIADRLTILENAVFSIISPKGCANILWKDSSRELEAAKMLKMTSEDVKNYGVVDSIIKEPGAGAHGDPTGTTREIKEYLKGALKSLLSLSPEDLVGRRYERVRNCGK